MKYFSLLVCLVALFFPLGVSATSDPYYARHSARQGSEVVRFMAAAHFLRDRVHPDPADLPELFCSLSRLLPEGRGAAFLTEVSTSLSLLLHMREQDIRISIIKAHCTPTKVAQPVRFQLKPLRLDTQGRVLSSNPVWNACIRGESLSLSFLRSNLDVYIHRQRRVRVRIPLTCRDYHRGDVRVWRFPEDPSVELVLDKKGRLLGDPPPEYVLTGP